MKRIAATLLSLSLAVSTTASGHGGGLDSNGCHRESATGTTHCHRVQNDGVGFTSASSEEDDLSDVWLIVGVASLVGLGFFLFQDRERYTFGPTLTADDDGFGDLGFRFEIRF